MESSTLKILCLIQDEINTPSIILKTSDELSRHGLQEIKLLSDRLNTRQPFLTVKKVIISIPDSQQI